MEYNTIYNISFPFALKPCSTLSIFTNAYLYIITLCVSVTKVMFVCSLADGNSNFKNKFLSKNGLTNTEPETTEMNEVENGRTVSDNASAQYATIPGAMGLDQATKLPSSQSIEYAPLSFNQANS